MSSDLERRYLRLVRLCYPAAYRHERGTEIVGTYLDLAAPHRRWPSAADVADLAGGGLRQRLRAADATGIGPGFRLAGALALLTATSLAGLWAGLEVRASTLPGLYAAPGIAVWAAWLLAGVVHLASPGRWTRIALGVALLLTVGVVPFADLNRPPLFVLLPQVGLGLVALGAPGRLPVWLRLLPLAGAAAAWPMAATYPYDAGGLVLADYRWNAGDALPAVGVLLLLVTTLLGIGLALRNDFRGGWALLVLLGPIGLLSVYPLAGELAALRDGGGPTPTWSTLAAVTTIVVVVAILVPFALLARGRVTATRPTGKRCPACGTPVHDSRDR